MTVIALKGVTIFIALALLAQRSWSQSPLLTAPKPEFAPSPLPKFLVDPTQEILRPPQRELITVPPSQTAPRRKRIIAVPVPKANPAETSKPAEEFVGPQELIEDTRDFVSDSVVNFSNRLDSFLGSKRADDELNRSSLRLAYAYRMRETYSGDDNREVRINLRLPSIDKRLKELSFRDPPTPAEKAAIRERKKREREPWRFRTDLGLNLSIPRPQAFTRGRLRKNWILADWIPRFEEELGYYTDRGVVNSASLNTDRVIEKDRKLFRFVNETEWRITNKRFTTTHGPSVIHNTSDDDVWAYNFRVSTFRENEGKIGSYFLSGYGVSVAYRRNLQGQWLYGEITPALDWPKARGFRRTPGITLKIESLFGRR